MLVISDIHFALEPLRRVVAQGIPLLILGDLVNISDYRTGEGAIADVLGLDFAVQSAAFRASGDYGAMRELWAKTVGDEVDEVRAAIGEAIAAQYEEVSRVLEGATGYVIHGNVDRPKHLRASLPPGLRYVQGEAVTVDGLRVGFVGGGVSTPLQAEGEVSDDEMAAMLDSIGPVDVLCTHVPPDIAPLRADVITGRAERGSGPVREYLEKVRPPLHLFGDVHQPQASTWRHGDTVCRNVGYFRATGRAFHLDPYAVERSAAE